MTPFKRFHWWSIVDIRTLSYVRTDRRERIIMAKRKSKAETGKSRNLINGNAEVGLVTGKCV